MTSPSSLKSVGPKMAAHTEKAKIAISKTIANACMSLITSINNLIRALVGLKSLKLEITLSQTAILRNANT